MLARQLFTTVIVFVCAASTCAAWTYRVQQSEFDGPYAGIFTLKPDATSAEGNVCIGLDFSSDSAKAACNALGWPIPDGYDPGWFGTDPTTEVSYMTGLSCSSPTQPLDQCSSTGGTTPTDGCNDNALFIDCYTTTEGGPTPPPTTAAPIIEMHFSPAATLNSSEFRNAFVSAVVTYMNSNNGTMIDESRVDVLDFAPISNLVPPSYTIDWRFTHAVDGKSLDADYLTSVVATFYAVMFPSSLNLTWIDINSPTPPPRPAENYNASEFTFRLADSQDGAYFTGRLEIRPFPNASWGTVCNDAWSLTDSYAACRSLGYFDAAPFQLTPDRTYPLSTGVVVMSNVTCDPELAQLLPDCSFVYSTATNKQSPAVCDHSKDVWLDCYYFAPPPTTSVPGATWPPQFFTEYIEWNALILTSSFTLNVTSNSSAVAAEVVTNFFAVLCDYVGAPLNRVMQTSPMSLGEVNSLVKFMFTQPRTMFQPTRMQFDANLQWATAQILSNLSIVLLESNATANYTDPGSGGEDLKDGPFVLQVDNLDRGLVWIRPKNVADLKFNFGVVCSKPQFQASEANAICLGMTTKTNGYDVAGAIPYFGAPEGSWIWLSDVYCKPGDPLYNCSYAMYSNMSDLLVSNCTDSEAAGVICAKKRSPVPSSAFNSKVWTYNAIFPIATYNHEIFLRRIASHFPINASRVLFTNLTVDSNNEYYNSEFFFSDNSDVDVGREDYDYFWQSIRPSGLLQLFGIVSMSSSYGAPNLPVTVPPFQWQNTTGWSWRLVSSATGEPTNASSGLLEVLPLGDTEWGTVCGGSAFGIQEAMAVCRTLGFNPNNSFAYSVSSGGPITAGPIYMSEVWCPDPSVEKYVQNCSFYYASNGVDTQCTHAQDVYVDCTGNGTNGLPTYDPRMLLSIVLKANHSDELFTDRWAKFFNMSKERVVISATKYQYRDFLYVNWTIIDDNSTIHIPTGNGGADTSMSLPGFSQMGSLTFPNGSNPFGSMSASWSGLLPPGMSGSTGTAGEMNLGILPSEILEMIAAETAAATLWDDFGIFEQRDNLTKPDGPLNPDRSTWTFSLESLDTSLEDKFGRVTLQPGKGAMYGTICSIGTDKTAALALCQQRNPSTRMAALIPFMQPRVGGVIYLSHMRCNDTTRMDSCTFDTSTFWEKNNLCSHLQDTGVLCGRGVIEDPEEPISYAAYVQMPQLDPQFCENVTLQFTNRISAVTGLPPSRFMIHECTNVAGQGSVTVPPMQPTQEPLLPQYLVNFTFSSSNNVSELTRGDLDLILQATNQWALKEYADILMLLYSDFLATPPPSNLPSIEPSTDIPMTTTAAPPVSPTTTSTAPRTAAPTTTAAPGTNAPLPSNTTVHPGTTTTRPVTASPAANTTTPAVSPTSTSPVATTTTGTPGTTSRVPTPSTATPAGTTAPGVSTTHAPASTATPGSAVPTSVAPGTDVPGSTGAPASTATPAAPTTTSPGTPPPSTATPSTLAPTPESTGAPVSPTTTSTTDTQAPTTMSPSTDAPTATTVAPTPQPTVPTVNLMMNASTMTLPELASAISVTLDVPTTSFNVSIVGPVTSSGMVPVEVVLASPELASQLSTAAQDGQLGNGVQLAPVYNPDSNPGGPSTALIAGAAVGGIVGLALIILVVKKVAFSSGASRMAQDDYVSMNAALFTDVDNQLL